MSINPIWITLGPIVGINLVLFISYLVYQFRVKKRTREFAGAKTSDSKFLSVGTREWWFWTTDPIVHLLVRLHIWPNTLTVIGFIFSVTAAFLFSQGWFGYAGWAMILGATFDIFDGRVARITGRSSRSGAFFDAVMDRFGEGACFMGLAYFFRTGPMLPVIMAALVGSFLVSYTKARAEGMGIECNVGTMQRPERIAYLGVASVLDPIVTSLLKEWWLVPPPILVMIAIVLIALMTNGTAIYRMIYTMNALDTLDKRSSESIPQIITRLSTAGGREAFWDRARYGYDRTKALSNHVVLFMMDGISLPVFRDLISRGDLPNISGHIASRGSGLTATSVFPSATGPACAPFVTGLFPGTCDIPGARWFDRTVSANRVLTMRRFRDYLGWGAYAMDTDLSKSARTIFEYSKQAVNIFGMLNRGCGLVRDPAFFRLYRRFHRPSKERDLAQGFETAFEWFSRAMKRDTDFVYYLFPPAEFMDGDATEAAQRVLRWSDDYVGRAADLIKRQGLYDETTFLFTSAHGETFTSHRFDLEGFLSKRYITSSPWTGLKTWHTSDLITLPSGTSMAHIYIRGEGGWEDRSFFEDIERLGLVGALLEEDSIVVLAGRSIEGGIIVQTRLGRAHILEDADGRITYLVKGSDPFGFDQIHQVQDASDLIKATSHTAFPDGPVQLLQIFRSRRTGDLVVSSKPDVTILPQGGEGISRATSGSIGREHIEVPFMSSVSVGAEIIRTVDVFALILKLLGIEACHAMDGVAPQFSGPPLRSSYPTAHMTQDHEPRQGR